ncbi:MAG: DNA primase [Clostridia bacterium]|nr:DNA primase [Clostridia bacterium]
MTFSDSFLDEVRARCDIVDVISRYTSLTKRGSGYVGLCPFHNEKTPSFSVSRDKQFYHCFGCGVGGDVITFIMKIENLDFPDAVAQLAERAGLALPTIDEGSTLAKRRRDRVYAVNKEAARFFHANLHTEGGREALEYLNGRGLTAATQTRFGLGYAPAAWDSLTKEMVKKGFTKNELIDAGLAVTGKNGSIYDRFRNRVMFPIIDVKGQVLGFGGRVMDDSTPKYLNTSDTIVFNKRKNLFALNFAKKTAAPAIILTEGYMDVIALHQAGFDSAVASLGTALTDEQVKLISRYKKSVIIAYDQDGAGIKATQRALELIKPSDLSVKVLRMHDAKDPDEYIKKFGRDRFLRLIDQAESESEYRLSGVRADFDTGSDEGKVSYLKAAIEELAKISSKVEREIYIARIAKDTGVSVDAIAHEVARAQRKDDRKKKRDEENRNLTPVRTHQPKSRAVRFDNPKSAIAEEGVIGTLTLRNDWISAAAEQLAPDEFSSPMLSDIYRIIINQHDAGRDVTPASVLGVLEGDASNHFSGILAREAEPNADALRDYIKIIKTEAAKAGEDALSAAARLYKDKKSYGG